MYKACCCILLMAPVLSGQTFNQPFDEVNPPSKSAPVTQTIAKIRSILMAMKSPVASGNPLSRQLAESMQALALPDRRPQQSQLSAFTVELAGALKGKAFSNEQGATLQQCIVDLMRSENVSNFQLARRLRDTLTALGISDPSADLIVRRFLAVGEAVRGPDDQGLRTE